jgi:tetratricopeptide (TPR) repeat protein
VSGDAGAHEWPPAETQAPEPEADRGDQAGDAAGGWSVRTSPRQQLLAERMAQKRREDAVRAATEAMLVSPAPSEGRRHKRRGLDGQRISRETVRTDVEDMLRRRKGADAAALLQRAAQEMGGRDIADLALDSGDRCRALGQQRAAINCFLAAWRSDPIYETPLWRLADACLTDRSVELAVGYLERIADLMRARGDDEGAMGVYRKIVAVAPDRTDIREQLRIAQISGRLAP